MHKNFFLRPQEEVLLAADCGMVRQIIYAKANQYGVVAVYIVGVSDLRSGSCKF